MKFSEEQIEAMTSTHVKIKCNGQPLPEHHGEWYDLATAEDVYLQAGEYQRISLGVAMEVPNGYYAIMAPRSSPLSGGELSRQTASASTSTITAETAISGPSQLWQCERPKSLRGRGFASLRLSLKDSR